MPPALRARSAALLVLLAEAADPVEVAVVLPEPVAAASVDVVVAVVVAAVGALKALEVELGYWLAIAQKICFWPW